MTIDQFRIETYRERETLGHALLLLRSMRPDYHPTEVQALLERVSQTECQPGGCQYCSREDYEYDDRDS